MKLVVLIAAYNERDNIEEVTRRLDRVLRDLGGFGWSEKRPAQVVTWSGAFSAVHEQRFRVSAIE